MTAFNGGLWKEHFVWTLVHSLFPLLLSHCDLMVVSLKKNKTKQNLPATHGHFTFSCMFWWPDKRCLALAPPVYVHVQTSTAGIDCWTLGLTSKSLRSWPLFSLDHNWFSYSCEVSWWLHHSGGALQRGRHNLLKGEG